ncbi:MAG: SDR family oxidoreductase [Anaerolineaceae bacterium]|nr:SDR family oxidoreductase [Anaerolineaceae bacterium]
MNLQLVQKIVLVTGASKGLGYAAALQFAKEKATVFINSRNAEALTQAANQIIKETNASVFPIAGDITLPETVSKIRADINENFGKLDVLICNAGGPPAGTFESFSDAQWQSAIDLSLMSQVRLIREALPLLRKSESASVVTVTSVSIKQPIENLILSNSVRAATAAMTKSLAIELGPENIRFNSILPGWTKTERVENLLQSRVQQNNSTMQEELAKIAEAIPLKRLAEPTEFANALVFLASPAASYITGVMLPVDGSFYRGTA